MPLEQQRDAFDLPAGLIYMNCASQSPSLKSSYEAGQAALMRKHHPWLPERHSIRCEMDTARELFGALIGASGENIAMVGATSYGAALAANTISLAKGQNIVVIEDQFPSNYYAWETLAQQSSAHLNVVARPADADWTAAILEAINYDTGLVALPHCHWADGSLVDLEKIAPKVHAVGSAFVIDSTQSTGVKKLDVKKINPDFLICSGYKWLLTPNSFAFLYVADRRLNSAPFEQNHSARASSIPMEQAMAYTPEFMPGARRFDHGGANNVLSQPITNTALEQIHAWGQDNIHNYMVKLIDKTADMASERGFDVPEKQFRIGHFIGLQPKKKLDCDLAGIMAKKNIYLSLRIGKIRISPYVFSSENDIDMLFDALDEIDLT